MIDDPVVLENVWFRYDSDFVLKNINLEIRKAEILCIVGPNGGGKSTLLKIIMGLVRPSSGKIIYSDTLSSRRVFGYMPQNRTNKDIFPLNAFQVTAMPLLAGKKILAGLSQDEINKIRESLDLCEALQFAETPFADLSGGQKQRVLIARAISLSPEVILLDEPSSGLDATSRDHFYELLDSLRRRTGSSIVMVSHDIGSAASVSDRVACLMNTIHYHGPPEECLTDENLEGIFGKNIYVLKHDRSCITCGKHHD